MQYSICAIIYVYIGKVTSSGGRDLLSPMQGLSGSMQGAVQKQAIFRQRILRQTHIVDQQEVADRSLVLDLLRKELSKDSAHVVGIGGRALAYSHCTKFIGARVAPIKTRLTLGVYL
jgi:hypothetical protein